MKTLSFGGQVLSIGTAAAILAACGGQSIAPQLPTTSAQSPLVATRGAKAPRYTIIDLGTLGGPDSAG